MQATARVGRSALITLPPEIREIMGIERGDYVVIDVLEVIKAKAKKVSVGDVIE